MDLYQIFNPSKLGAVDGLLSKYKGNEPAMFAVLKDKYLKSGNFPKVASAARGPLPPPVVASATPAKVSVETTPAKISVETAPSKVSVETTPADVSVEPKPEKVSVEPKPEK